MSKPVSNKNNLTTYMYVLNGVLCLLFYEQGTIIQLPCCFLTFANDIFIFHILEELNSLYVNKLSITITS